ncbi:proteasome assembly chaperone family protein [Salinigranum rubrum]|uniref:Proteasome assembly chaperone family protein n=1 Tax=Salinigranum rubrum TaxID=755307 RepID=A0A2I8VGB1_9EURY|nr:proteasome assembly chaperone family protein [Salinigranum rubrum]AUV80956.1 proteasome assembly chaperone family protein [Salinigranum rubrum]
MDDIEVEVLAEPELSDPILIEGLPGVGHVGKLAVEHLLEEFESEVVRRVYATEFPPQVTITDGVAELASAELHAVTIADEATDDETDGIDLLVLTGDHQAQTNAGHYRLTEAFLDLAEEIGVQQVFALGGVPTGELVEEPSVLGAVSAGEHIEALEDVGVEFREDEPAGGVVGVSGLMLGLGGRRGLEVACLMGETSGYLVDPKSAQAVLVVLEDVLGFDVSFEALEERAEEMEEVVGKIQEMQDQQGSVPTDDDLRYIG